MIDEKFIEQYFKMDKELRNRVYKILSTQNKIRTGKTNTSYDIANLDTQENVFFAYTIDHYNETHCLETFPIEYLYSDDWIEDFQIHEQQNFLEKFIDANKDELKTIWEYSQQGIVELSDELKKCKIYDEFIEKIKQNKKNVLTGD